MISGVPALPGVPAKRCAYSGRFPSLAYREKSVDMISRCRIRGRQTSAADITNKAYNPLIALISGYRVPFSDFKDIPGQAVEGDERALV